MRGTRSRERLTWNENYTPDREETVLIRAAIVERGLRTRDAVANAVGNELFVQDCRTTSHLDGFGIFRRWYVQEVRRLLDQLVGTAIFTELGPWTI
jgi:hypothetical protein